VVMVVTSVILLIVTDGLNLFGQYARLVTNRVVRNTELWSNYCRLESLVTSADSLLKTPSGKVEVYHKGEVGALSVSNNMLLFLRNRMNDTLFYSVIDMDVLPAGSGNDSLSITIAIGGERLRLTFAPWPRPKISTHALRDLEERYGYE